MKKIYAILLLFLFARAAVALPGTLVSVDPDSAFQGQNLIVTVNYPSGTLLTFASPGDLKFSGSGLPTFTTNWSNVYNYDPFNDVISYMVQVPPAQAPGLYDVTSYTGYYDFFNNTVTPTDSFQLAQAFTVSQANVFGKLFIDNNNDGIYSPGLGDRPWANKRVDISPDSISVYTGSDGVFFVDLPNGTHTIHCVLGAGETVTTGNFPATVTVTTNSLHDLGLIGVNGPVYYSVEGYVTLGRRCNRVVYSFMEIHNYSNRTVNITASLVLSPNIDYRSASPSPALISGDTLIWNFTGVSPGGWVNVNILDSVPSAGDTLRYWLNSVAYNGTTPVDSDIRQGASLVACSFDPNDKAVSPPGVSLANYTLKGEELFYHINFQNTGNDTAYDIVVRDTLDADLDLTTFVFLSATSPAIVTLNYNTRIVEFRMNNIMLPDSNVNEPLSHGYINYKINHTAGIPDGTEITNTAHIYFDFNPPVATNTTLNTMVTIIPTGIVDPTAGKGVMVIPNPFSESAQLIVDKWNGETCLLQIWNELGELILTSQMKSGTYQLSKGNLSPGLYFYRVDSKSGSVNGRFMLTDK